MRLNEKCPIIEFKNFGDNRGSLIVIESGLTIPFSIQRVFYIFGCDNSAIRGRHANIDSEFVLINVAGKSKVRICDGHEELTVELDKPLKGVYIPKMIWKEMFGFSKDSVLLVLASTHYNSNEYINDFEVYKEIQKKPLVESN